jgi:hypothetical protein
MMHYLDDRPIPFRLRPTPRHCFQFVIERIVARSSLADDLGVPSLSVKTYHKVEEVRVVYCLYSGSTIAIRKLSRSVRRRRYERLFRILRRHYRNLEARYIY